MNMITCSKQVAGIESLRLPNTKGFGIDTAVGPSKHFVV
jgi:hypothetical protein